jgi:hypothetical protein
VKEGFGVTEATLSVSLALSLFYRRGREEEIEVNKGFGVTEATLSLSLALSFFTAEQGKRRLK